MIYTIYSYWNITELTGVFNAIAALVGSPDYGGALKFLVLVAVISLAMAVLSGRGRMDEFWQWTLMAALFNGFLLAPKSTVQLVDETGTSPPAVISNVPIGLAAIASGVSTIGYWLTTAYETVYALPSDLNFEANGMMFGQRVQKELLYLKPATVAWQNDFNNYYSQCLAPDILSGTLTQDQINTSSNIWSILGNTNPGLYVTLSTVGTVNCPTAYNDLTTRLNTSEVPTTLQQYAVSALPQTTSPALAVTGVSNTIVDSSSYFNGIATSANAAVQQGVVSNAIIDAHCNMLAQSSNTALANECLTQSEGFRQTNSSYQAMANIAQSSMPKVRNAIELILYAIFPIILIFVVVAGHKALTVLAGYVRSLVWIQLWPPLYAVVNYMMNVHAAYWANATGGNAMALQYQQWIASSSVSDQAIAGMLVVAIPPIAWGIVKGGEVGLQAIGSLASPPHSVEKLATQMAEGNFQNGQMKTAADITTGSPIMHHINENGSVANTTADGVIRFDKGIASDNMNFKAESGSAYASKLATESKTAFSNAQASAQQAGTQWASNWNDISSFIQQHGHDSDLTSGDNLQRMGTISNANQAMQTMTHKLTTANGLTQSQATTVTAMASAGLATPIISAELRAQGMSKTEADHVAQEASDYATQHSLTQQTSNALNAIRGLQFSDKNSSGARGAHDISAGFEKAQTYQNSASNELRRSEELANKAELVRSDQNSLTNDRTTQVVNSIIAASREPGGLTFGGHTYRNLSAKDIDSLMRQGDPDMQNTVRAFSEKLMDADVQALVNGQMQTENGIKDDFAKNSLAASGKAAVFGANAGNQGAVKADQAISGISPGQQVANPIAGSVSGILKQASNATNPTTSTKPSTDPVMPGGMPSDNVSGTVLGELNNPGTVMRTFHNAASSVIPDATNHLAEEAENKLGIDSGAYFEQKAAERFKGSDMQALIETGIDLLAVGGGMAAVGAAGRLAMEATEAATEKTAGTVTEQITENAGGTVAENSVIKGAEVIAENGVESSVKEGETTGMVGKLGEKIGQVDFSRLVLAGAGASVLDKEATDYLDGSSAVSEPVSAASSQPTPAVSPATGTQEAANASEPEPQHVAQVQAMPAQPAPAGSPEAVKPLEPEPQYVAQVQGNTHLGGGGTGDSISSILEKSNLGSILKGDPVYIPQEGGQRQEQEDVGNMDELPPPTS